MPLPRRATSLVEVGVAGCGRCLGAARRVSKPYSIGYKLLVGGLEHNWITFAYIGNNNPN